MAKRWRKLFPPEREQHAPILSHESYLKLRNTIFVLRGSGAKLTAEQRADLEKWEAAVAAYEQKEEK